MKVLFLSAWYPHRYDAMAGLFVRKHAEAVSRYAKVCVLYMMADENVQKFDVIEQNFNKVHEIYIYYPYIPNKLLSKVSKTTETEMDKIRADVEGGSGNGTYLGTRYGTFPSIPYEAFIQRTSHFNGRHSQAGFGRWATFVYNEANIAAPLWYEHNDKTVNPIFDPVYDGKNGLEFMRDRLGYRLVLRDAKASEWVPQNGNLKFEGKIQNVGFGNVVNKKNVWVILKSKTGSATYTALASLDARDWKTPDNRNNRPDNTAGYRDLNFSVNLSAFGKVPAGNYDIFLKITDPLEKSSNLRCIQFANKGSIWNEALGANLVGSTEVL